MQEGIGDLDPGLRRVYRTTSFVLTVVCVTAACWFMFVGVWSLPASASVMAHTDRVVWGVIIGLFSLSAGGLIEILSAPVREEDLVECWKWRLAYWVPMTLMLPVAFTAVGWFVFPQELIPRFFLLILSICAPICIPIAWGEARSTASERVVH